MRIAILKQSSGTWPSLMITHFMNTHETPSCRTLTLPCRVAVGQLSHPVFLLVQPIPVRSSAIYQMRLCEHGLWRFRETWHKPDPFPTLCILPIFWDLYQMDRPQFMFHSLVLFPIRDRFNTAETPKQLFP